MEEACGAKKSALEAEYLTLTIAGSRPGGGSAGCECARGCARERQRRPYWAQFDLKLFGSSGRQMSLGEHGLGEAGGGS